MATLTTRLPSIRILALLISGIACMAIAGCQYSLDTTQRSIAYNQDIARYTNDLFLLNALRASQRQPTYYTRNGANSAISSLTPTLNATVPLRDTRMFSSAATTNSNPIDANPGFLNSQLLTSSVTHAVTSLMPGLSATESNQLSLTNLDDQQSMNGLLSPVTPQQMSNYLTEGYNPEEMFLLLAQEISIGRHALSGLDTAVEEHCAATSSGAGAPRGQRYCEYLTENRLKTELDARCVAGASPAEDARERKDHPKQEEPTFSFVNDPAISNGPLSSSNRANSSYVCFRQILLRLLALNLSVTGTADSEMYTLPASIVEHEPRLLGDWSQQGLDVFYHPPPAVAPGGSGPDATFSVCKKSSDMVFSIVDDTATQKLATPAKEGPKKTSSHLFVVALGTPSKGKADLCSSDVDAADKADDTTLAIKITPRSLEGMVYYLGQIIRHQYFNCADGAVIERCDNSDYVTFRNFAPEAEGGPYDEELFRVIRSPLIPRQSVAAVTVTSGIYYVPDLCDPRRDPGHSKCSAEYPEHASAQVLTVLNQLWGLNKTATSAPLIPTVTVIGH